MHKVYEYRLRNPRGAWVADVIMRSDGYFSTVSDYGNYAYWWGSPGGEFRAFVAQLERQSDYVCSKLARRAEWYDAEGTLKAIKQHILTYRREGSMTKERAAEEWDILVEVCGGFASRGMRDVSEMDQHQFHQWYERTQIGDAHEFMRYDYRPDVRGFCEHVMPLLATAIREELAKEQRTPAEVASAT
jgi:hypothetical protein